MKAGDLIEIEGRKARVLGKGGEFVAPEPTFEGWALDSRMRDDTWEHSPSYGGEVDVFWYAVPVEPGEPTVTTADPVDREEAA